jgi:hypothetical protein
MNENLEAKESDVLDILDSSVPVIARYNQSEMPGNFSKFLFTINRHWIKGCFVCIEAKKSFKIHDQNVTLLSKVYAPFDQPYF